VSFDIPFKLNNLQKNRNYKKNRHQFQNETNRLADEADVQLGHRIVETVDLLCLSFESALI
jgi:hypothetical protein